MRPVRSLSAGVCLAFFAVFETSAATFTVINTNDTGTGSLRWAITNAMASAAPREVDFNLSGGSPYVIKVGAALPTITNATAIRGDTQPGYTNTPLVQILGPSTTPVFDFGLWVQAGGATIRGLRFSGFSFYGVSIDGAGSRIEGCLVDGNANGIGTASSTIIGGTNSALRNVIINNQTNGIEVYTGGTTILGNFIGVDSDGVTPAGNGDAGIRLWFADNNTIYGGSNFPQVISGNKGPGILVGPNLSYVEFSDANTIYGNLIGTDVTGMNAVSNQTGIYIWGGSRNTIGGTTAAQRNIIAGNTASGIDLEGVPWVGANNGTNNAIIGNYVGLAADGETVLPNYFGVLIGDAERNRVGGTAAGEGNRFGRSTFYQVMIQSVYTYSQSNTVQGNWFGISVTTQLLANSGAAVNIGNSSNNLIGGSTAAARNYLCGASSGINITGTKSRNNRVMGNWIGLGPGIVRMDNSSYGVQINNAPYNQIGGIYSNEGNVISANDYYGMYIHGTGAVGNVVQGNFIGTDPTGTLTISNRYSGVDVSDGASTNTIGGTNFDTANVIGGNGGSGIVVRDTNTFANFVTYNYIGLTRSPYVAIANGSRGIEIQQASRNQVVANNYIGNNKSAGIYVGGGSAVSNIVALNLVGMDDTGAPHPNYGGIDIQDAISTLVFANYVSGNQADGVSVRGAASNTWVTSNRIGVNMAGAVAVSNASDGIYVEGVNTLIGGTNIGNVVSGNGSYGIYVTPSGTNTVILGNYIGVDGPGTNTIPNGATGVRLEAPRAVVGGTNASLRNVISGNRSGGITLGLAASNAVIQGNYIGVNALGTAVISNLSMGVSISGPGCMLGGASTNARNIIAGNQVNGVEILTGADNTTVQGNYIGVDVTGSLPFSNKQYGVYIHNANNAVIGGVGAARNVITASRLTGLLIDGTSSNTVVAGNYIGTSADGLKSLRNGTAGIGVNADYVTIGLAFAGGGNVICGSGASGIDVTTGAHIRIVNNIIGLAADGSTNLPNGAVGIYVHPGAGGVAIGGTNANERNYIARNNAQEILLQGRPGGHTVQNNYIGLRPDGLPYASAESSPGIELLDCPSNAILGNVVGQQSDALYIRSTGSFANVVQGNSIGEYNLDPYGSAGWGVNIQNASGNRIGGTGLSERNVIAQNNGGIVVTTSLGATNNLLGPNVIYSNGTSRLNIDLGGDGTTPNDALDADTGANNLQNTPVLTNGFIAGNLVYAQGVLTSAPSRTYAVDIYRNQDGTNAGGRFFIGRVPVTTDGGGVGTFTAGFIINLATSQYLAATATDPDNNTSEFNRSPSALANATGDTDGDLIPNFWETLYGLNPAVTNAQGSDADGDGYSDLNEYIADTAANDSNAYPHISAISNQVASNITFPSSGARVYQLQYNDALLTNPVWAASGGNVTGVYGSTTMTDAGAATGRGYRVSVRLP